MRGDFRVGSVKAIANVNSSQNSHKPPTVNFRKSGSIPPDVPPTSTNQSHLRHGNVATPSVHNFVKNMTEAKLESMKKIYTNGKSYFAPASFQPRREQSPFSHHIKSKSTMDSPENTERKREATIKFDSRKNPRSLTIPQIAPSIDYYIREKVKRKPLILSNLAVSPPSVRSQLRLPKVSQSYTLLSFQTTQSSKKTTDQWRN
eukprot:TRINITY_DN9412_c0_g1_i9.p1 TRINITY_DN9412_c0_g1~~TRINITY_DN9412_c0_g1_i9.p1  ORF type:complete len:203 (-),score=7.38 TRINITY_DN9412_c0_g1_i9:140-748(-)